MQIVRKIIACIVPLILCACLFYSVEYKDYFFYGMAASFIFSDIAIALFLPRTLSKTKSFVLSLPFIMFVLSVYGMALLIGQPYLLWGLIGFFLLMQYLYFYVAYRYMVHPQAYEQRAIKHVVEYITYSYYFFTVTVLLGLVYYLDVRIWYVVAGIVVLTVCSLIQTIWSNDLSLKTHWLFGLFCLTIIMETMAVVWWLPTIFYANAFIITMAYAISLRTGLLEINKQVTKKSAISYIIIFVAMLLLVLVTSRWR